MKPALLITDVDSDILEYHGRFFGDFGYRVETATNGLDCLALLRRGQPDLLILDLDLADGPGILIRMREQGDIPCVPVILIGTAPERLALEPPAVAHLRKPYRLKEVLDAVVLATRTLETGPLLR